MYIYIYKKKEKICNVHLHRSFHWLFGHTQTQCLFNADVSRYFLKSLLLKMHTIVAHHGGSNIAVMKYSTSDISNVI